MNTTTSESERTPLVAADLSAFAKALRTQLAERLDSGAGLPGHVEMLNLLARAAGHRNVQALKAAAAKSAASAAPTLHRWHGPKHPTLSPTADRALRVFDARGCLLRWPGKRPEQVLALWCLWMAFDGKRRYSEREVNEVLNAHHAFGEAASNLKCNTLPHVRCFDANQNLVPTASA
jgi:Uncharacterized protein conserved in bacteria (DUF2087)